METKAFERLVNEALDELPQEFRKKLENVAVIVKDRPSRALLRSMEIPPNETLFGLYEGTPLTERGFYETPLHPDRIFIFQEPIEEACETEDEMKEEVKTTVMHEIAHFFGFEDDDLEDRGY